MKSITKEIWKDITDYPGYQVSNFGRVRSFWKKKKKFGSYGGCERVLSDESYILPASDDGNGYLKVFLVDKNGKRHCRKIHRMVAEEFIPNPNGYDTVDHIVSGSAGKLDNTVDNLRWLSRQENIQKAYTDGMCDARIRRQMVPVMVHDWCGCEDEEDIYCESVREAGELIGVHYTSVTHAINDEKDLARGRYTARYADLDEKLYYGCSDPDPEFYEGYYE